MADEGGGVGGVTIAIGIEDQLTPELQRIIQRARSMMQEVGEFAGAAVTSGAGRAVGANQKYIKKNNQSGGGFSEDGMAALDKIDTTEIADKFIASLEVSLVKGVTQLGAMMDVRVAEIFAKVGATHADMAAIQSNARANSPEYIQAEVRRRMAANTERGTVVAKELDTPESLHAAAALRTATSARTMAVNQISDQTMVPGAPVTPSADQMRMSLLARQSMLKTYGELQVPAMPTSQGWMGSLLATSSPAETEQHPAMTLGATRRVSEARSKTQTTEELLKDPVAIQTMAQEQMMRQALNSVLKDQINILMSTDEAFQTLMAGFKAGGINLSEEAQQQLRTSFRSPVTGLGARRGFRRNLGTIFEAGVEGFRGESSPDENEKEMNPEHRTGFSGAMANTGGLSGIGGAMVAPMGGYAGFMLGMYAINDITRYMMSMVTSAIQLQSALAPLSQTFQRLGLSGSTLSQAAQTSLTISGQTGFTPAEIAPVLGMAAAQYGVGGMNQAATTAAQFGSITQTSPTDAYASLRSVGVPFGTSNLGDVSDQVVAAAQKFGVSMQDVLSGLQQVAVAAADSGLSLKDTTTVIGTAARESGQTAATEGSAMARILANLPSNIGVLQQLGQAIPSLGAVLTPNIMSGGNAAAQFQALGQANLTQNDIEMVADKLGLGRQNVAALSILNADTSTRGGTRGGATDVAGSTVKLFNAEMGTFDGQLKLALRDLENFGETLFSAVLPELTAVVTAFRAVATVAAPAGAAIGEVALAVTAIWAASKAVGLGTSAINAIRGVGSQAETATVAESTPMEAAAAALTESATTSGVALTTAATALSRAAVELGARGIIPGGGGEPGVVVPPGKSTVEGPVAGAETAVEEGTEVGGGLVVAKGLLSKLGLDGGLASKLGSASLGGVARTTGEAAAPFVISDLIGSGPGSAIMNAQTRHELAGLSRNPEKAEKQLEGDVNTAREKLHGVEAHGGSAISHIPLIGDPVKDVIGDSKTRLSELQNALSKLQQAISDQQQATVNNTTALTNVKGQGPNGLSVAHALSIGAGPQGIGSLFQAGYFGNSSTAVSGYEAGLGKLGTTELADINAKKQVGGLTIQQEAANYQQTRDQQAQAYQQQAQLLTAQQALTAATTDQNQTVAGLKDQLLGAQQSVDKLTEAVKAEPSLSNKAALVQAQANVGQITGQTSAAKYQQSLAGIQATGQVTAAQLLGQPVQAGEQAAANLQQQITATQGAITKKAGDIPTLQATLQQEQASLIQQQFQNAQTEFSQSQAVLVAQQGKATAQGKLVQVAQQQLTLDSQTLAFTQQHTPGDLLAIAQQTNAVLADQVAIATSNNTIQSAIAATLSAQQKAHGQIVASDLTTLTSLKSQVTNLLAAGMSANSTQVQQLDQQIATQIGQANQDFVTTQENHIQAMADIHQITSGQELTLLQELENSPQAQASGTPVLDQIKEMMQSVYNQLANNLQFDLPSDINIEGLYYTSKRGTAVGGTGGYNDNRTITINLGVDNAATMGQVTTLITNTLGTGQQVLSTANRRY